MCSDNCFRTKKNRKYSLEVIDFVPRKNNQTNKQSGHSFPTTSRNIANRSHGFVSRQNSWTKNREHLFEHWSRNQILEHKNSKHVSETHSPTTFSGNNISKQRKKEEVHMKSMFEQIVRRTYSALKKCFGIMFSTTVARKGIFDLVVFDLFVPGKIEQICCE